MHEATGRRRDDGAPEAGRFLRGIRSWVGFTQVGVEYERAARFAGRPSTPCASCSGARLRRPFLVHQAADPDDPVLRVRPFVVAILIALFYFAWYFIAPERFPAGFASLFVSIWFFAGVQLLCMGIVGEYVVRTYEESRARPVALVREIVGRRDRRRRRRARAIARDRDTAR